MGPPFRFSAKYGLFTYAQCGDLDPFAVVNHFASLRAECIIGRENHADGGLHLHAFVMWERRFETTSARKFDVQSHHPNIQAGYGTPEKGWDYATKDGDVVGGGLERPSGDSVDKSGSKWSEIILAESAEDFWRMCGEMDPRSLCCNFTSLQKYVEWKYRTDPAEYASPAGVQFDIRDTRGLVGWCEANLDAPIVTGKISYTYARVLASARGFTPRPREQPARQEPGLWCADSYLQRAVADVDRKTKVIVPLWRHKTGKDTMGQISGKARLLRRTILPGRIS